MCVLYTLLMCIVRINKTILPRTRCYAGLFVSPPATEGRALGMTCGVGIIAAGRCAVGGPRQEQQKYGRAAWVSSYPVWMQSQLWRVPTSRRFRPVGFRHEAQDTQAAHCNGWLQACGRAYAQCQAHYGPQVARPAAAHLVRQSTLRPLWRAYGVSPRFRTGPLFSPVI